jgi:teichuronic acid exporter
MSSVETEDRAEQPRGGVRAAYAWAAGGTFAAQGVLWLLSLFVMGILQPADYGLVGIIGVFFSFCKTVQDAGLSTAIVQRAELNRRLLSSAFWFFVGTGALLTALAILAAPVVGRMNGDARIPALMRVLSVTFLLVGLRTVPTALLTRALDFRRRSTAEILSSAVGAVTTAVLAFTGHGVWSLVFGGITGEAVLTLLTCLYAKWTPSAEFDRAEMASLLRFGLPVTGSTLIWEFYIQSDFLMIGLVLGTQQLGWYTLAWQLGMVPADRLTAVMNKANLPVFASLQKHPESLRHHWRAVIGSVAWLAFPMAAGIALVGTDLIHTVLPAKWAGAIPVLPQLAILGGIRSITVILPNLLVALGKPLRNLLYNCVCALVYPPAFAIAAHWGGLPAVGWTWVVLLPTMMVWLVRLALPSTPLKLSDYFAPLGAPAAATAVMSLVVLSLGRMLRVNGLPRLEILIAAGILSYGAMAAMWFYKTGGFPWSRRAADPI